MNYMREHANLLQGSQSAGAPGWRLIKFRGMNGASQTEIYVGYRAITTYCVTMGNVYILSVEGVMD
jgi:hypothetical protein